MRHQLGRAALLAVDLCALPIILGLWFHSWTAAWASFASLFAIFWLIKIGDIPQFSLAVGNVAIRGTWAALVLVVVGFAIGWPLHYANFSNKKGRP